MADPIEIAGVLIRRFEGLYLRPYLCPAGVPTIGYGATYYETGVRVSLKDEPITKERAEQLLVWMVTKKYLPAVILLCPNIEGVESLAAIIDFTFNLGSGNLRSSTLRRKVNEGDWNAAQAQLRRWDKAGGRVLKGLTIRREAEINLIRMNHGLE